jgi:quinol monooxygenase YgiN
MIRHIVLFNARDPADLDAIVEGLTLLTGIAHADVVEVARNRKIDQLANDADVVVYAEFADEEALAAFKADPIYQQSIQQVRPLRELRIAADYDTAKAAKRPALSSR